jgi:hypothetical protein
MNEMKWSLLIMLLTTLAVLLAIIIIYLTIIYNDTTVLTGRLVSFLDWYQDSFEVQ